VQAERLDRTTVAPTSEPDPADPATPGAGARPAPTNPAAWSSRAQWLGWALIGLGALLRVRQYLYNRSLWRDEAALVYNVLHRGYLGFSRPLSFEQGTPPGFFVVEKAMSQVLGSSELALRFFPLVCSVAALVIGLVLVRRHLAAPAGLVALSLCATSPSLIYFGSEVKQYSTDVLMALLVILAASSVWRNAYSRRSCVVLALVGAVAIPFSHAATFVLLGAGLTLAWPVLRRRDRSELVRLASVGAVWVTTWGITYALFDRHLDSDAFLRSFWSEAFLPIPPTTHHGVHQWTTALSTLFSMLVGNPALLALFAILAVVGIAALRRRPGVLAIVLLPWIAVVIASSFQLYPATERLALFLIPLLAVLVGAGAAAVAAWLGGRSQVLGTGFLVIVVVLGGAVGLRRFVDPQPIEELRPLLQDMSAHARPGDYVFVASTAVPSWDYYRDHIALPRGLHVIESQAATDDEATVEREIAPLRGQPFVWVVSSAYWQPEGHIRPDVTAAFARVGHQVTEFEYDGPGASVALYDLPGPPPVHPTATGPR
jgi:Dolichyl-phosphate-mannose-protein mannosyltransferase